MPKHTHSPLLTGNKEEERKRFKILLIQKGVRQVDIARELGVKRQTVNGVINRHYNCRPVLEYLERLAAE